mgnify:CR=1 FL=1
MEQYKYRLLILIQATIDYLKLISKYNGRFLLMKNEEIIVGDLEGKYVKGQKFMGYGSKLQFETLRAPEEMRFKGDNDYAAKFEYTQENNPKLFILKKMLTDWSKGDKINNHTITQVIDPEIGELLDEYVEKVKEINGLMEKEEEESKNEEEDI